jgi:transposase
MSKTKRKDTLDNLAVVHPNAAGLDIGSREIWAGVPPGRDVETVKRFNTFTPDLQALADWLVACGVDTVAMESTGVYWIPVFELLEARGLKMYLVNSWHLKHVPGRKSDYLDCQWIQKLHALGLLNGSFRPDGEMVALRGYLRHRAMLLAHRAPHILHMQKALQQMNLQLHHVLSDITGETGLQILRAMVAGERNPVKLAQHRNPACKSSEETIAQALTGNWKAEHLFTLRQSLALYDFYTQQVTACDAEIEKQYAALKPRWDGPGEPPDVPRVKPGSKSKNQPQLNVRREIIRLTGVDLVAVEGISASLAQTILSETGTDMSKWPSDKHFGSWLGLAPHNDTLAPARKCRCFGWQSIAEPNLEDPQPGRASLSPSGRLSDSERKRVWGVLSAQAGAVGADASVSRHCPQNSADGVLHVEEPGTVSRHWSRSFRTQAEGTGDCVLEEEGGQVGFRPLATRLNRRHRTGSRYDLT